MEYGAILISGARIVEQMPNDIFGRFDVNIRILNAWNQQKAGKTVGLRGTADLEFNFPGNHRGHREVKCTVH